MEKTKQIFNDDIYFLNIGELSGLLKKHNLETNYYLERDDKMIKGGSLSKRYLINDLKSVVVKKRIPSPIVVSKKLISGKPIPYTIHSSDKVYYDHFKHNNKQILKLMKELTNDEYRAGAISASILRESWFNNKLLSYKQFAKLWLEGSKDIKSVIYPECALIKFCLNGGTLKEWNKLRPKKAKKVIAHLDKELAKLKFV